MFIDELPEVHYADPWVQSFEERLITLKRRSIHVAYFYERPDTSTFRYRVFNMIEVLNALAPDVSAAWFCAEDIDNFDRVLEAADVLVICRSRYNHHLNEIITRAKSRGSLVIFDVDDFVFDVDYVQLVVRTLDQDFEHPNVWDFWFAYIGRVGATLRLCDRIIVTNDFLAAQARRMGPRDVRIIPNFLNSAQLEVSRRILQAKRASGFARDHRIHLGYFSGTPSHNRDFEIISEVLHRLLAEDHRLRLRAVGFLDLKGRLGQHQDRIERHPLCDFLNLQRLIGSTEINLVPLQDNTFTQCKSELKYFEAAIVGTVTIASPTYTLRSAIRDGVNGLLAHEQEWEAKLRLAIRDLEGSGDRYAAMAELAAEHSLKRYHWENQLPAIRAALFDTPAEPGVATARSASCTTNLISERGADTLQRPEPRAPNPLMAEG
jgi:glycosyltransferase involved in cell wall biosynthesis